ncbi:TonB-dependent receptor [Salmonella enterica subsp. enterica serovar Newport]|uniref:TonB-dependent receptor n=1 Tax=Salmonella newport TaxID=108619 RepID=A0A5U9KV39_SALNE|nr:TonB-dependent receptor [Salmonella enterica subsp. enterica serovar Newport]ECN8540296.1 TonB-dependent receptor [Salmonella enterica subsp. enterica serovar Newport]EJH8883017.1 TonB-dependent receptor [Salmonella enterica]ELN0821686.1 TonB-dependent receptor [Salmonella enterica]
MSELKSDKTLQTLIKKRQHSIAIKFRIPSVIWGLYVLAAGDVIAGEDIATRSSREENSEVDTIIVTGEKVARTIYDTSASVEIFDDARISAMPGASQVSDLLKMTANVVDTGIGNDVPTIRGIDGSGPASGANAFLNGTRPRLNLSLDGRSLTYNELAFGPQSLWDMEQVEVYRGPQSYIQGRNSIAGAIVMSSKDPTFDWESSVKASGGNQGSTTASAMLSGPIIEEQLAFRLSADRQRRDSFVNLISYEPVGNPREIEATNLRGKLLFNPVGLRDLTTKFTVNHFDSRAPQNETLSPANYISPRFDRRRPVFETTSTSNIWDIAWEPSERLSIENKFIYTDFDNHRRTVATLPWADINGKEIQTEPLIRFGKKDDRIKGMIGGRYFHTSQDEFVNMFGGSKFKDKTETWSVFGELTWAATPYVDITAASRVEREHRERKGGEARKVDFDETWDVFLPKLDVAWKPLPQQTYGVKVARGYNAGGAGMTFFPPLINYTYDPEYVWNYELYSRHGIKDWGLELTTNLFYNDYKDMQLPYYLSSRSNAMVIRNANKVETYGAEFGAIWKPIVDLELNSSVGLLKTKIKKFANSGIDGNELPRAPSLTASLGAKYTLLPGLELSGDVRFTDTYYSQYDNDSRGEIPSSWVANIQLAYTFTHGRVSMFAQNLFDSDKRIMVINNDIKTPVIERPRLVGVAVQLDF